jgi:hypothetical protein
VSGEQNPEGGFLPLTGVGEAFAVTQIARTWATQASEYKRERDALVSALKRIRKHVGLGAADIITANHMLGRIDQEARQALKEIENAT